MKVSVLLLEDDWDNRAVFRSFLEHRGWDVAEAENAGPALEILDGSGADIVVVDLGGTDGWKVLEALSHRSRGPRVICLTGDGRTESRARATRLGADAYLVKPIRLHDLGEVIQRLRGVPPPPTGTQGPRSEEDERGDQGNGSREGNGSRQPAFHPGRPVVLLLEDDDDARAIYRDILDFSGFEVMAVSDGLQGLRCAEDRAPDVVVTDLHMPGMNGIEVARAFRERGGPAPAIIAVTADSLGIATPQDREGTPPLFDEVMVKPVSPGDLARRVRAYAPPYEDD